MYIIALKKTLSFSTYLHPCRLSPVAVRQWRWPCGETVLANLASTSTLRELWPMWSHSVLHGRLGYVLAADWWRSARWLLHRCLMSKWLTCSARQLPSVWSSFIRMRMGLRGGQFTCQPNKSDQSHFYYYFYHYFIIILANGQTKKKFKISFTF